jgi:membrane-associated phospholipid phosphatase
MLYFSQSNSVAGPFGAALQPPSFTNAGLQPHIFGTAMLQPHIGNNAVLQPHIIAPSALQPHIVGKSALQPHIVGGSFTEIDSAQQGAVGNFGWPWFGVDPSWAFNGMAALQAQAMDKVRSKILRAEDPRAVAASARGGTARSGKAAPILAAGLSPAADLWRWQGPFRVKAVVAEITGRIRVGQQSVVWLGEASTSGNCQALRLFKLDAPGKGFDYRDQIDKVLRAAVERQDRVPEILIQADGIALFFDAVTGIDRSQAPRLAELLEVAWEVTTLVVMALKNSVAALRPFQRNDGIQPLIPTPGHGSLPSGHATMSVVASELLASLRYANDPERCDQLDRLVRRIAFNRVVAGVHFPMDSLAGYELGRHLAATLVAAARTGALPLAVPLGFQRDSELREADSRPAALVLDKKSRIGALANWSLLWRAAQHELQLLRV